MYSAPGNDGALEPVHGHGGLVGLFQDTHLRFAQLQHTRDQRGRQFSGRKPRDHGGLCGFTSGEAILHDRRHQRDQFDQHFRFDHHHAGVQFR